MFRLDRFFGRPRSAGDIDSPGSEGTKPAGSTATEPSTNGTIGANLYADGLDPTTTTNSTHQRTTALPEEPGSAGARGGLMGSMFGALQRFGTVARATVLGAVALATVGFGTAMAQEVHTDPADHVRAEASIIESKPYTVVPGDSMWRIAQRHGVSL